VNTPESYERRLDRTLPEPNPAPEPEKGVEALAVHQDPSQPSVTSQAEPDRSRPTVAWVRPSELPTLIGAPWVRRGIDLQSELTRRARRSAGAVASRAARRVSRTAIARTDPATPTNTPTEGLEL